MKVFLSGILLCLLSLAHAQQPKELEFHILPCTNEGAIKSDGTTCTLEDVKKHQRQTDKILTKEEQKIEKLSHKRDPLKLKNADKKRSRGIWVRSGN